MPLAASVCDGVPVRSVVAAAEAPTCAPGLGSVRVLVRGDAPGWVESEAMRVSANSGFDSGVVSWAGVGVADRGVLGGFHFVHEGDDSFVGAGEDWG